MAARPSLPYFAPTELLPAPLPTVAEILASTTRLSKEYEKPVVRVGEHFAVKFGGGVHLQEGENMLFVQQSTRIPVPKVYALFHDKETEMDFIVQEYIPGKDLDLTWGTLGTTEKQAIVSQLHRYLHELRSIPSPGYYGGIWKQQIRDYHFTVGNPDHEPYEDRAISGPHETEEQWAEAMFRCVERRTETERDRRMISLVRRHYYAVFKGHEPVFTHGNILPRNLMLRDDGTVVIIDWERAGWYPSFWEYCCTVMLLKYIDDWGEWISEMLDDEYHAELGWMSNHRHAVMYYFY